MRSLSKIILLLAALAYGDNSSAQHYIPDRSFGNCGSNLIFLHEQGERELKEIKLLPGGKILLAGNFFHDHSDSISLLLLRFTTNGQLDTGFGTQGVLLSRIAFRSYLNGITTQPGGGIIAAGHQNNSLVAADDMPAVYRFTEQGKPDSTWNGSGIVTMRFDDVSSGSFYKAIVLNDDKIVAAGLSVQNAGTGVNGIGIVKLSSTGEPDNLFGNLPGFPGRSRIAMDSVKHLHLFSMNSNLVLPFVRRTNLLDTVYIARLLPDGNTDNSFGAGGVLNTGIASENLSAVLQQDGKLLMGGTLNEQGQPRKIQLLRYAATLLPDAAFGDNGHLTVPTTGDTGNDNVLHSVVQQADGKILIIGHFAPPAQPDNLRPFILRLLENGDIDSSFNGTGSMQLVTEFFSGWNNIAPADAINFLVSRTQNFELLKYVPDTTGFENAVVADFDFAIAKQTVFFNDRSINGEYFYWDFGDGQFSQQANPSHQYALPGSYVVTLYVSGPCDGQTIRKTVIVNGIYKITPGIGPNRGFTQCRIYGYGFDNSSQVMLKNASATLTPENIFFDAASQTLQANFRFIGASLGLYDLMVTTGSRTDTLEQGFEIQPTEIGKPWVQLVGPYNRYFKALTGERVNTYRLEYGVTGNATQYLIPLFVVIRGTDLNAEILSMVTNKGDTMGIPDSMKPASNGCYRYFDELNNDSVWVFYGLDEVVEANTTHVFEFQVISKTVDGDFGVFGYIGKSLYDAQQLDTLYSRPSGGGFCSNACISCLLDLAGFVPGPIGCLAGVVSTGCAINNFATTPMTVSGMLNLAINFASTGVSCGTMSGSAFGKLLQGFQNTIMGYTLQQASNGVSIIDCATAVVNFINTGGCGGQSGQSGGNFKRFGSFDPNIKLGPASYNTRHYIAAKEPLNYTTYFENLATATAPAYRVVIKDTIDKSVLDIASFQFGAVGIGNETYPVFSAKDSFAMDIPVAGRGVVCRVQGNVDTAAGVVTWLFTSLDSSTMELIKDQANGFLPPNIDSINGRGYVAFTIGQKSTNTHLTAVSNKASIVFDFNAPIITPLWTNIVDTVKPQSQVLNEFRVLTDSAFSVKWSGFDADAGIRNYRIYVSENNSPYYLLGIYGRDSTVIKGTAGSVYRFVSIAIDSVNNMEEPPADAINNPDAIFTFSSPLPVQLLSFSALKENGRALLKWSASSEVNSAHYILEHSGNGNSYLALAKLNARGTGATQSDYQFTHVQPVHGLNYYRLKMVDRDGKFEYSPVRRLQFEIPAAFTVLPNPATGRVYISVTEPGGELQMISSTGEVLKVQKMIHTAAAIDISGMAPGIYFVRYKMPDSRIWHQKLLIQSGL